MSRPKYSPDALDGFYARIGLPEGLRRRSIGRLDPAAQHDFLATLVRFMTISVPFENLSLHYSQGKSVVLDHDCLYRKIVGTFADENVGRDGEASRGPLKGPRGGYCMENNQFFGTIMRTLGYQVCPVGARVYGATALEGWGHQVNLVTIGAHVYAVDVGFGANGPTHPLRIPHEAVAAAEPGGAVEGPEEANLPGTAVRLIWSDPCAHQPGLERARDGIETTQRPGLPSIAQPQTHAWIFQTRITGATETEHADPGRGGWKALYGFTTQEFLPQDYMSMNHWTSTSTRSFFTYKLLCVRVLGASELDDRSSPIVKALDATGKEWSEKWRRYVEARGSEIRDTPGAIAGQVILSDKSLKIRVVVDNYAVAEFKSERERLDALGAYFGIRLTGDEERGIQGMVSEIT